MMTMKKFVHALNAVVAYIGMEKFGNAQIAIIQRKIKNSPHTGFSSGEEPFTSMGIILQFQFSVRT